MKLGYIWYEPEERDLVQGRLSEERPTWELTCVPEHTMCNLSSVLRLLNGGHDAVLVHLSLRYCLALKMAEVSHRENTPTRVILFSRTVADPEAIAGFFDGHINPDRDIYGLAARIERIVQAPRSVIDDEGEIDRRILRIFNASDTLKAAYLTKFKIRHKSDFTLADYHRAIGASSKPDWDEALPGQGEDVFISYSNSDETLASEIARMLKDAGVSSFLAARDIKGGDTWEPAIRQALRACQEQLLLLTPNSVDSTWVMIEAGAAWSLGKRVTPCVAYVDVNKVPEPISKHQARPVITESDKAQLVQEVHARILTDAGPSSYRDPDSGCT